MPNVSNVDEVFSQANKREKEYDWLGAVETYKKELDSIPPQDLLRLGELQERLGYAFRRAAMQADEVDEFRDRMKKAAASYDKAREAYTSISQDPPTAQAKVLRSEELPEHTLTIG